MLERTAAITKEILEPVTYVLAYHAVSCWSGWVRMFCIRENSC